MLRGHLLLGSFPFGDKTLQTRTEGAFFFEVSEGRGKKVKYKQTNKKINKIKQIQFLQRF